MSATRQPIATVGYEYETVDGKTIIVLGDGDSLAETVKGERWIESTAFVDVEANR